MAFHFRPTETARYVVALQLKSTARSSGAVFTLYCDTIADVRDRLVFNTRGWDKREGVEFNLCLSNGYTPRNLPAGMVKTETRRYGRCTVAKRSAIVDGEIRTEEAVVFAIR